MRNIVILGCTGSIGDTTFKVLESLGDEFRVLGLSGGRRVEKLIDLARRWRPERVVVGSEEDLAQVREALPHLRVEAGIEGLVELATLDGVEIVINGLVGAVGLEPTLAALAAGKTVAMANKEPIVMAGGLILETAGEKGGTILPLDSEPNALWQCLKGEDERDIERLILTASGGPFFGRTHAEMARITPAQALAHPTWKMGSKITVDSATLMNKGFEVIEAGWLFSLPIERVDVVIHRQSAIHSMVEFVDGSILAHIGKTDMLLPIQYALTHPRRMPSPLGRLDLVALGQLTFAAPDRENFPCLEICYEAGRRGGAVPAELNAANEVAVAAFLAGKIPFADIGKIDEQALERAEGGAAETVEEIKAADERGRRRAREWSPTLAV